MVAAVSVVANGGELLQPRLVRAVIRDGQRLPVPRTVLGRAVSKGTAAQLTGIMESVVVDGTGKNAQVSGYTVAGKTGTAAKPVPGGYSTTRYVASFVGVVPAKDPRLVVLVSIDEPVGAIWGGVVAAPAFSDIARSSLVELEIAPDATPDGSATR
jgi:stage V sporulation protein D (sporulation-specific penicillin-binding protein)